MNDYLQSIAYCVEHGKSDARTPYPPELAGQEGAGELTLKALEAGVSPGEILAGALIPGMERVGVKFRENQVFLPEVLMSARAMTAAVNHLQPYFNSGEIQHKGLVLLGTVAGDLHDIGKKIVGMFLNGGGWQVVDLGVDVEASDYLDAIAQHKPVAVGLSALLTTTMGNMAEITGEISKAYPGVKILVGGAPVNAGFAREIGAHFFSPDPQGALEFLNNHS